MEIEKGVLSFSFTPYRMNRAPVLLLCSNTPHGCLLPATTMHILTNTRTHTLQSCLTVGTITLLRGNDRGLKVERMRLKKRLIKSTRARTAWPPLPINTRQQSAVWLSGQLDSLGWICSVLSLIHHSSVQSGQALHAHNVHMPAHSHTCLVKGGPVVLFHRGSRVVITDLRALYLIAHTQPRRKTHSHTSMYSHAHFHRPFSSAVVVHDLDHTQTHRLVLQGKEVPKPHTDVRPT